MKVPLSIAGDPADAAQMFADCKSFEAFRAWAESHVAVVIPDPASGGAVRTVVGPSVPTPESDAHVWFKTSSPEAIAIRTALGWAIPNSGEGSLRPIWTDPALDLHLLNADLVELDEATKAGLGLTGRWGRVEHAKMERVMYLP